PSSGDGAKAMPHATATPRASATPDPRVEQVKAVAREFVRALWDSAKSGDAAVVERFVESGTQAAGNADVLATNSREGHHNFITSRVDFIENAWIIDVVSQHAHVEVAYTLFGHDADWPSLAPRESDHQSKIVSDRIDLEFVQSQWLVYRFNP